MIDYKLQRWKYNNDKFKIDTTRDMRKKLYSGPTRIVYEQKFISQDGSLAAILFLKYSQFHYMYMYK